MNDLRNSLLTLLILAAIAGIGLGVSYATGALMAPGPSPEQLAFQERLDEGQEILETYCQAKAHYAEVAMHLRQAGAPLQHELDAILESDQADDVKAVLYHLTVAAYDLPRESDPYEREAAALRYKQLTYSECAGPVQSIADAS